MTAFVVWELVDGSAVPSKRAHGTRLAAGTDVLQRLMDDYADCSAERFGVDEETGKPVYPSPADEDFVMAMESVVGALDGLIDVEFRSTRWWVSEEHEETGW